MNLLSLCVLVLVASSAYSQQSSYYSQPQQLQQTPITFNSNQPLFSLPVALKSSPNDQIIMPQPGFQPPVAFAPSGTQQSVQTIGSIQQQIASNLFKHRVLGTNVPNIPRFCSFQSDIECDPNFPYRQLNGSCNNLNNLWWGKAETPYKRYLDSDYADKVNEPRASIDGSELPNARDISCTLHREAHEIEPFITHIFMQWGQIVSHDISSLSLTTDEERDISSCDSCVRTQKCMPIMIQANVSCGCVNQMRHECLEFLRSSAAFGDLACNDVRREQLNLQTSYLDASIVYGIIESDLAPLIEGRGKFKVQRGRNILPPDMTPEPSDCIDFTDKRRCFLAGDNRVNQNPGLQMLQTVLVREHNRIAEILGSLNPTWNDRTVFEETRRIVIAQVQHITYNEYVPILLGENVARIMGLLPLQGTEQTNIYDSRVDPRTANEFAAGVGRFGHSMIRSIYSRVDSNYKNIGSFMLRNKFFRSNMFYDDDVNGGLESVARGFLKDPSMKVDRWFTEDISRHLFETNDEFSRPFHFDLVSVNIQRGRDHGLPAYVKFREFCKLAPIRSWDEMRNFIHSDSVDIFMSLYKFVEDVDLYSAGLSEFKQNGALVGPTFTCVLAKQFRDLKFGDRFWYETSQAPASFTPRQLAEIRKMSLSKLLCRNLKDTPKIQPRAMISSKLKENALIDCSELTDIDWSLWKS